MLRKRLHVCVYARILGGHELTAHMREYFVVLQRKSRMHKLIKGFCCFDERKHPHTGSGSLSLLLAGTFFQL